MGLYRFAEMCRLAPALLSKQYSGISHVFLVGRQRGTATTEKNCVEEGGKKTHGTITNNTIEYLVDGSSSSIDRN